MGVMERKDILFIVAFVISLSFLIYYSGTSITGFVVQETGYDVGNNLLSGVAKSLNHVLLFSLFTAIVIIIGIIYFKKRYLNP